MSSPSTWEQVVAVGYVPLVVMLYVLWAARELRPLGDSWSARARAALAKREPSVLLDSARVVVLALWMGNTPDMDLVLGYLRAGIPWCQGYGVFHWIDVLRVPPGAVVALVWTYRAALALLILGVLPRWTAAIAAICHAAFWSVAYSTAHGSVHNHAVFMILVTFALLPEPLLPLRPYLAAYRRGLPLSQVGSYPAYARFGAMFAVATVYVETGIEKVLTGGPRWFNGITLQGYVQRKGQLSTVLADLPFWALTALAVLVVAWESAYGAALFRPRLRPYAALSAVAFHEWVRWGMGVSPFVFMEAANLFVFTPYEIVALFRSRREGGKLPVGDGAEKAAADTEQSVSREPAPAPDPLFGSRRVRVGLILGLAIVQWIPLGTRRGVYPFLSNAMFSGALRPGHFMVGGARIVVTDGGGAAPREIPPEAAVSIRTQRWNELVFEHYLSPFKDHKAFAAARPPFCPTLLRELTARADPRAARVSVWMDYFLAGQSGMRTEQVDECGAVPGPAGPSASLRAPAPREPGRMPVGEGGTSAGTAALPCSAAGREEVTSSRAAPPPG